MDKRGREYVRERMPMLGLGTYQVRSRDTIFKIIDAALEVGYRFIDTAQVYGNEGYIGEALQELLPKHGLKREDIVITTKISPSNQGAKKAGPSIDKSMENLKLDYIDIVIIHWPGSSRLEVHEPENALYRRDTWKTLEKYYQEGKIKAIGVSNYEIKHLEELLGQATVLPCLNQVEYHPFFHQTDLVNYCKEHDIHFQAYSSLGGPDMRETLFSDPNIIQLAEKYTVPVATLLLAWAITQGMSVLPRSTKPERVKENFHALKVEMTKEDVQLLLDNKRHEKGCWDPAPVA